MLPRVLWMYKLTLSDTSFWKLSKAPECSALAQSILIQLVLLQTEWEHYKRESPIVGGGLMGSSQYPWELGSIRCMQRPQHQLKRQARSQDF